jgi:hypothetical protein
VITLEPTLEGRVGIGLAIPGDPMGVGSVEREFEKESVGVLVAGRLDALFDRPLRRLVDPERDVMEGSPRYRRAEFLFVALPNNLSDSLHVATSGIPITSS